MRVWIDQDLCVGNGICQELCPEVFYLTDGDIAYIRDGDRLLPKGIQGALTIPAALEDSTLEAAEECPAACIYIEVD